MVSGLEVSGEKCDGRKWFFCARLSHYRNCSRILKSLE